MTSLTAKALTKLEPKADDIIVLPSGGTVVQQKLTGKDFFEFQAAILSSSAKGNSQKTVEGLQAIMLKAFKWSDGRALTIEELLDEEGIGFSGCSLLSEKLTELFGAGRQDAISLPPAG